MIDGGETFAKIAANALRGTTMNDANAETITTLDATGLLCPLPVLKARRALKPLAPGAVLEVLATDPARSRISSISAAPPAAN